ncbi:MAG TPA: proline iminopeptidase-family hydrolase [Gemmatimonadaceae bacterium]|nr:proline iminopeptidase-family hydrolase [Gemmatimonadaceae bacterium]
MIRFRLGAAALMALSACRARDGSADSAAVQAGTPVAGAGAPADNSPLKPGEARLAVDGGHIWYRVVGSGTSTPAILVHGGPGYASYYMTALEALGADRPVVRYDQLGAGKSDRLTGTTRMTIQHFVQELESLRARLGYEKFHLVGHSWGTILGFEYYRAHPERVASLTLAGAVLDVPAYARRAKDLVATLSDSAQRAIRVREAEHKYDAPDYQAALGEFYGKYVWRHPNEAELDSTTKTANEQIYNFMQGPSEFTITGTIKSYDATPYLKDVHVPVLYVVGEFDEVGPELVRSFARRTPGAQVFLVPQSGHLFEWDNPGPANKAIRDFLRQADEGRRAPPR